MIALASLLVCNSGLGICLRSWRGEPRRSRGLPGDQFQNTHCRAQPVQFIIGMNDETCLETAARTVAVEDAVAGGVLLERWRLMAESCRIHAFSFVADWP